MTYNVFRNNGCFKLGQPLFFVVVLFSLFITSCQREEQTHRDYQVLLSVDDVEVNVFEFETKYIERLISTGQNDTKTGRYQFLNEMIDNLVLAKEAEKVGLTDHPTFQSAIRFQKRKSMMDIYFVDEMDRTISPPTDDEVRLAYAKKQRKVYVSHLFSKDEEEINEAYQRLENGEDFRDVANDFYETPAYDSLAGYLGPINYFGVDDAFAEAAFSTTQDDYTTPVRSMFGFHIIYVDYIEFPAILAEDEYQYRKQGIESQVKLRKQKLVSNTYVRDLMSTLLVEPDEENILGLREAILNLSDGLVLDDIQDEEQRNDNWNDSRLDALEASFDNEKVLATYVMSGQRQEFTFEDYLNWLPYLSFNESKNRTGASVGRGLRNEVLYQLAEGNSYANDDRVIEKVENRGYDVLSQLYQNKLRREAIADTTSVTVPSSFKDRLIRNKQVMIQASYWKILASDLNEAETIKEDIQSGGIPESYDTFEKVDYRIIPPTTDDYSFVNDGLLETPVLAHSQSEGWMVFYLIERDITALTNNTQDAQLETRYKIYKTLNDKIVDLRDQAEIKVDTTLFNDIYEVWKKKALEEAESE